jgi:hypothetical protein
MIMEYERRSLVAATEKHLTVDLLLELPQGVSPEGYLGKLTTVFVSIELVTGTGTSAADCMSVKCEQIFILN